MARRIPLDILAYYSELLHSVGIDPKYSSSTKIPIHSESPRVSRLTRCSANQDAPLRAKIPGSWMIADIYLLISDGILLYRRTQVGFSGEVNSNMV